MGLENKQDPIFKLTKAKRVGDIAQVIECLYDKREALSSNPIPHTHTHTHTQKPYIYTYHRRQPFYSKH
jgi:hypothetical protein